jgi:hypothetical protein
MLRPRSQPPPLTKRVRTAQTSVAQSGLKGLSTDPDPPGGRRLWFHIASFIPGRSIRQHTPDLPVELCPAQSSITLNNARFRIDMDQPIMLHVHISAYGSM